MLSALATADAVTWVSIVVKALVYAASLLSAGSVLCAVSLRGLPPLERRRLAQLAALCAVTAAALSLVRIPLRASFLMGGTWHGAFDPMILNMVVESPLGTSIALRLVGLALILLILIRARATWLLAVAGAVLVVASFVFSGHTLGDRHLLLGLLVTLHLWGVAFWIGAFAPLYCIAGTSGSIAGQVAHDFGRKAVWIVAILTVSGVITLWLLAGNPLTALSTPYGQLFVVKLTGFSALLGLAAWNKLRLTPGLLQGAPGASMKLRKSILLEATLVAGILITTAALTTVSAPVSSLASPI
jgi:putative copper resistance protein D